MKTNVTTLPSGLRVISVENPYANTVNISVWINVGSRFETILQNGISHLIEHMVFKGTQNRSESKILEDIYVIGGKINAFTSVEFTFFTIEILKEDLEIAVDILSDLTQNPIFSEKDLKAEKKAVCQEIRQIDKNSDYGSFSKTVFGTEKHHGNPAGTIKNVQGFTPKDLFDFMQKHYTGPNMLVIANGSVQQDNLLSLVEKYFTKLSSIAVEKIPKKKYNGGFLHTDKNLTDANASFKLSFDASGEENKITRIIVSTILGGDMASKLYNRIRSKKGLVYSISAAANYYLDGILLEIEAISKITKFNTVLSYVCEEIIKLYSHGITEYELTIAKRKLIADYVMAMEDTQACIRHCATSYLVDNYVESIEEMVAKINKVTVDEVNIAIRKFFSTPLSYMVRGNIVGFSSYETVQEVLKESFEDAHKTEKKQ